VWMLLAGDWNRVEWIGGIWALTLT
jgi:hypothetical protein